MTDIPTKARYEITSQSNDPYGLIRTDLHMFLKEREAQSLQTICISFLAKEIYKDMAAMLRDLSDRIGVSTTIQMFDPEYVKITGRGYFILVTYHSSEYTITTWGEEELGNRLKTELGKESNKVRLTWWYTDVHHEYDERDLDLEFNYIVHDEYYPYISGGIGKYFEDYHKSSAPILLLMGEAGLGKTSLIKEYIKRYQLNTVVTYDEKIMSSDYFYIQYLIDSDKKLLVIEDADMLLSPRDQGDNAAMSKLLNISDGLIKLESKKIIFSTNIQNYNHIDTALIRPGRCFDVLNFRKLSYDEAMNACKVGNINNITEKKDYTLSELFNQRTHSFHGSKIGFSF